MTRAPLLLALCGVGEGGRWPWPSRSEAGRAVVGAALFELALQRRLELSDDRVVPCGGGATGDVVQDQVLRRVGTAGRARAPSAWVERLGPDALRHVEEECAGASALGVLGERVGEARARVRRAAERPDVSDTSALAVAVLLIAARRGHLVRPTVPPEVMVRQAADAVALLEFRRRYAGRTMYRKHREALVVHGQTTREGIVEAIDEDVLARIAALRTVRLAVPRLGPGDRMRPTTDLLSSPLRVFLVGDRYEDLLADHRRIQGLQGGVFRLAGPGATAR
ncbi:GPP34 family phosphoprotein [Streptomyces sp. NPDC002076]